ncbi:hypothetical protein VTK56DRAFT_6304 [Thermocarpiscus australiensis]
MHLGRISVRSQPPAFSRLPLLACPFSPLLSGPCCISRQLTSIPGSVQSTPSQKGKAGGGKEKLEADYSNASARVLWAGLVCLSAQARACADEAFSRGYRPVSGLDAGTPSQPLLAKASITWLTDVSPLIPSDKKHSPTVQPAGLTGVGIGTSRFSSVLRSCSIQINIEPFSSSLVSSLLFSPAALKVLLLSLSVYTCC